MIRKFTAVVLFTTALSINLHAQFLNGEFVLPARAAAMSAYTADPDFAHAVLLNPAKLSAVSSVHLSTDYEYLQYNVYNFSAWFLRARDVGGVFSAGPIGSGLNYGYYEIADFKTNVYTVGAGIDLPFGPAIGIAAKYITYNFGPLIVSTVSNPNGIGSVTLKANKFTFDLGTRHETTLANNDFIKVTLALGTTFSNVLAKISMEVEPTLPELEKSLDYELPQHFSIGAACTFASNQTVSDLELFRFSIAADYSHLMNNARDMVSLYPHKDLYRFGIEGQALEVLAIRVGYNHKTPEIEGISLSSGSRVERMGDGFSYGFSLHLPIKLFLPSLPVTSFEMLYGKNPQFGTNKDHDIFGVVAGVKF